MLTRTITSQANLSVTAELLIHSKEGAISPFRKVITLPMVADARGQIDPTPLVRSAFDHMLIRPNAEISLRIISLGLSER